MKHTKIFAALAIVLLTGTAASAQIGSQRSDIKKIKQGVRSGELTKKETHSLLKQQKHIRKEVCQAKADGQITAGERREIKKDKMRADVNIYRKKHNNRDRN